LLVQQEELKVDACQIAETLFAALAAQDEATVRELCSPTLRLRQNNGPAMNLEALLAMNRAVGRVVRDVRYCDAVRSSTASGFVEEHTLRGILPDGSALELAVCAVADFENGTITEVREYFDSAAAKGLLAALA
jgi:ketosteroid isomerase-like protein